MTDTAGRRVSGSAQSKRDDILGAAEDAFAVRGFRGAPMADIAAAAGLTQQGVLHYFASKKHLLLAVLERREDTDIERVSKYEGSYLDALLELCRHNAERPGLIRLFVTLSAESTDPENPGHLWFQHRYSNMRNLIAGALRQDQQAGLLAAALDADALSVQLIALFDGLQLQWLLAPDEVDMVSAMESFIALVRTAS